MNKIPGFASAADQTFPTTFGGLQAQNAQQNTAMDPRMLRMMASILSQQSQQPEQRKKGPYDQETPVNWMQAIGPALQNAAPAVMNGLAMQQTFGGT